MGELARLPNSKPIHALRVWLWTHRMTTGDLAKRIETVQGRKVAPRMLSYILAGEKFAGEALAEAISKATQGAIGKRATMNPEGAQARRLRKLRQSRRTVRRNKARTGEYRKMVRLYIESR